MKNSKPIAIDLFCGAGGMSLGFEQAGFRVVAAFDLEDRNVATYEHNLPHSKAFALDLSRASGAELRRLAGIGPRSVDVIFGGPPCQGFSVGGTRDTDDKRNLLVYEFARLVRELRPRYFVMENVKGLLLGHARPILESLLRRLRRAGYAIVEPLRVLDAVDFGVPQRRERTFVLGCLVGLPPPLYPTPRGCIAEDGGQFFPRVRDAIADLPAIEHHGELLYTDVYRGPLGKPSAFAELMRAHTVEGQNGSRRKNADSPGLTGCRRTQHRAETVRRFRAVKPGECDPVSRFARLRLAGVAPTLRAGTGPDRGSHTAPRPIHPRRPRCITVREAARLHSFPDWFRFHDTQWHAFRQIGNSVPPLLAKAVAVSVLVAWGGPAKGAKERDGHA